MFTKEHMKVEIKGLEVQDALALLQVIRRLVKSGVIEDIELAAITLIRSKLVKQIQNAAGVNDDRVIAQATQLRPARAGSKLIRRRIPVAAATLSRVRVEGLLRPLSGRAITACVVRMRFASCCCVRPARPRASIIADASENSSSSAAYSFRYAGSFIHVR